MASLVLSRSPVGWPSFPAQCSPARGGKDRDLNMSSDDDLQ